MTVKRWAVAQLNTTDDVDSNLKTALRFVREAADEGCSLLAFPEVFLYRGSMDGARNTSRYVSDEALGRLQEAAEKHAIALQAGSILSPPEESNNSRRLYNTALLIDQNGSIVGRYRKIHLFDVELPEFEVKESELMIPGDRVIDVEADGVRCGLSICYDLRFPELYRQLSSRGVEVLFVPSNFTLETGRAHWEPLLRARAIENQAYVVAPNLLGKNPHTNVASLGQSMIVDPWGQVVCRMSDQPGWTSARLDFSYLNEVRQRLPSLEHRAFEEPA